MLRILKARYLQGYRTMKYPEGPLPALPARFTGKPVVDGEKCSKGCSICARICPTGAISCNPDHKSIRLDTGLCIFCGECEKACPEKCIHFGRDHSLSATKREDLIIGEAATGRAAAAGSEIQRLFGRSLKLRQVSAGGCNACEADTNVLNTPAWDLGRFGIQFVASPRHADGLLITGPVTNNMELALRKAYEAVPAPKLVIAVGACAISGGLFRDTPASHNGAKDIIPVDLFVPGCPPHPATILEGLLRYLGVIDTPMT